MARIPASHPLSPALFRKARRRRASFDRGVDEVAEQHAEILAVFGRLRHQDREQSRGEIQNVVPAAPPRNIRPRTAVGARPGSVQKPWPKPWPGQSRKWFLVATKPALEAVGVYAKVMQSVGASRSEFLASHAGKLSDGSQMLRQTLPSEGIDVLDRMRKIETDRHGFVCHWQHVDCFLMRDKVALRRYRMRRGVRSDVARNPLLSRFCFLLSLIDSLFRCAGSSFANT